MRALALLAALVAALVIPGAPPGIGVVVVALLIAGTALTAARRSGDLLVFGAPAVTLAAFPALLDARWIVIPDIVAAWLFATFAVGGPRLVAPLAPVAALPQVPQLLPASSSRALPALRGTVVAAVLAIPFATLFLTGDAAFAAIADGVPRPTPGSLPGRMGAFAVVLLAALSLALGARRQVGERQPTQKSSFSFVEWALPLLVLDALFVAFVSVQVTVLFGGNDHVLRTTGLTYSEYAREGFWQLIAAATLTLIVVKAATLVAKPKTSSERRVLELALGILCVLTIVVVASALHRLMLYENAFGLTRPRLAAEGFAVWLAGTFAVLLVLGTVRGTSGVPRVVLAWTAFALVGFSVGNPDARIAERNVARWHETGRLDVGYLSMLSADAAPELAQLPPKLRRWALARTVDRLSKNEPLASANLSRSRARRHLRSAAVSAVTPGLP